MTVLSLVVLTVMVGLSLAYNCGDVPHTDGCSVWSIVPYKKTFRTACDKHDVCYSCGRTFGTTRGQCDKKFKSDMYKICSRRWWPWGCERWALIYYKAVDLRGHKYYVNSRQDWCKNEPWYKTECMP